MYSFTIKGKNAKLS